MFVRNYKVKIQVFEPAVRIHIAFLANVWNKIASAFYSLIWNDMF